MKQSKVRSCQVLEPFEGKHGTLYPHQYELEDGTSIKANHKKQGGFEVGTEVEYTIKGSHPTHGNWGSVSKPKENTFGGGGGKSVDQDAILFQVCLKGSIEIHAHKSMQLPSPDEVIDYARELATKSKQEIAKLKA